MPSAIEKRLPSVTIDRSNPLGRTRRAHLHELLARRESDSQTSLHLLATGQSERPFVWFAAPEMDRRPGLGEASGRVIGSVATAGTSRSLAEGTNPKLKGYFDRDLALFLPGQGPDGEPGSEEEYPIGFGYGELILVDDIGPSAQTATPDRVARGNLVSGAVQFKERFTGGTEKLIAVNPELYPESAALIKHFLPIAANTILHGLDSVSHEKNMSVDTMKDIISKQRIVVNGAGLFGLLAAKMCQQLGAENVVIADIDAERLKLAAKMGLTTVNRMDYESDEAFLIDVKNTHMPKRTGDPERAADGAGADFVIEFSGAEKGFENAIRLLHAEGKVIEGGMLKEEITIHGMGNEFHHFSPDIVSAQIGRVPRHQKAAWDRDALSRLGEAILLSDDVAMADGAAVQDTFREHILTHVIPMSKAEDTYLPVLQNRHQDLGEYALNKDVKTTGMVFYYDDAVEEFFLDILPDKVKNKYLEKEIEQPIDIAFGGEHRLVVHEGKFSVLGKEGNPIIQDARPSISFNGGEVGMDDNERVVTRTKDGKGVKIEIAGTETRPGMTTEIMTGDDGLRIKQEIVNTTGKDITFNRFTGLDTAGGLGGVDPKKMWASATGWTVWEPPIEGIVEYLPQTNQIAIRPHVNDERYDIVSKTHPDGVPILGAVALRDLEGDQKFFMGYLPREGRAKHFGVVEPRRYGLEAWNDGEGITIQAGKGRKSEELVIRFGEDPQTAREQFAKEYAERVGVVRTERPKPDNGFVTWYDLFNNIAPNDVPELIDATAKLREHGIDVNYFTLDDVHNPAHPDTNFVPPGNPELIEDFLRLAYGKGSGSYEYGYNVKAYAAHCEANGLRPEIWMSPFIVSSRAPAFQDMVEGNNGLSTDMLLKNRDGEIFVTHYHPEQDADFFALDLTNKQAQDFVRSKIKFFTDLGIKGLKFDFVYPAALQGKREDTTATAMEAYNIGLQIVQEETTDKVISALWGGQPIYETAGNWVGRLAPDSEAVFGIQYDPLPQNAHLRRGKSLRNAGANSVSRAAEGYHLYGGGIDFDPTPVAIEGELDESRIPTSTLSVPEMRFSLAIGRAMGTHGRLGFGHDPRLVTPLWIQRYMTALETDGGVSTIVQVDGEGYPVSWVRDTDTGREVTAINRQMMAADVALDRRAHGIPDGVIGEVLFPDSEAHTENGTVVFRNIPPHGAQVYKIPA